MVGGSGFGKTETLKTIAFQLMKLGEAIDKQIKADKEKKEKKKAPKVQAKEKGQTITQEEKKILKSLNSNPVLKAQVKALIKISSKGNT